MGLRQTVKYIHEPRHVAAVDVELIKDETAWSPCLSLEDAYTLDGAPEALRREDLERPSAYGRKAGIA